MNLRRSHTLTLPRIAVGILLGMTGATLIAPPFAQAAAAIDSTARQEYNIAAGQLSDALAQFAATAGVPLSFNPQQLAGKRSNGLRGRYTVREGFDLLLTGSGFELQDRGGGAWSLRTVADVPFVMTGVSVVATESILDDPGRTEGNASYVAPSTNTAFKLPLTPRETPQTVTVIPQAVIEDFALTDIRKMLLFTPGVHVAAERGSQAYYFLARGNYMQTQLDGVPAPNKFGGRGEGVTLDAATIDRVEVLHGASGLLIGPGSPGGTVNVNRKMPTPDAHVGLEAGNDSWGGYRSVADVSGPLGNSSFDGRLIGVYEKQGSFIDHSSGKHSLIYGVLDHRFGDSTVVYVGMNLERLYDASFGNYYGLPTELDGTPLDVPRSTNLGATWSDHDETQNLAFLRLRHEFSTNWSLQGMFTHENYDYNALESVPGRTRDPDTAENIYLFGQLEKSNMRTDAVDVYIQGRFDLLGRQHEVMFGFNGAWRDSAWRYYTPQAELALIDVDTWDPRNAPDPFSQGMELNWGYDGKFKQHGAFGGGRFSLWDGGHLIVGGRLSSMKSSFDGVVDQKEKSVFTPYAGLVWDFTKQLSAYASYSEIFEPYGSWAHDIQGNILPPKEGKNFEAGLKVELFDGAFNASLATFRLDQANLDEPDFSGEAPGICGGTLDPCLKAAGLVRSTGVELAFAGKIADNWQIFGGLSTLNHERRTGDLAGQRFDTTIPEKQLHLATSYTAPDDRWSLGASIRYQGEIHTEDVLYFMPDQEYRIEQNGYTVVGLFGSYRINPTVEIALAADNLLDKKYFSGLSWPVHGQVYGDARRLALTLRAEF